jgi:hypothetical protein
VKYRSTRSGSMVAKSSAWCRLRLIRNLL